MEKLLQKVKPAAEYFKAIETGSLKLIDTFINQEKDIDRLFQLPEPDTSASLLYFAVSLGQAAIVERLVRAQADVNLKASDGTSPLYLAAKCGHQQVVKVLLRAQADLDIGAKSSGATPLYVASLRGHEEVARMLIRAQASLNIQQMHGATPLYIAVQEGHMKIIDMLINAGADVNVQINSGECALHYASQSNLRQIVKKLLTAHADANLRQDEGISPLISASFLGHFGLVDLLLSAAADPTVESRAGYTALHLAAQNGHYRIVQMLLKALANIDHLGQQGYSPLYAAAQNGHAQIVKALIAAQANVNLQSRYGATPLYVASGKGNNEVVKLLLAAQTDSDVKGHVGDSPVYIASQMNNLQVVRTLVKSQANVNTQAIIGFTPLHIAAQEGHYDIVDVLAKAQTDANLQDSFGFTPLFYSSQNGHQKVVATLIRQANPDVNLKGNTGETPLHAACQLGHHGIAQLLIKAQADLNIQQLHGCTAIYLAVQNGHEKVVDALIKAQADADIQPEKCSPPLYSAIFNNHRSIALKLIRKARVDFDQRRMDGVGDSSLHLAVQGNHRWAMTALLNAQANVNIQTTATGWSPLHVASYNGREGAVLAMIEAQADVDLLTWNGEAPLTTAQRKGHDVVIRSLINAGAIAPQDNALRCSAQNNTLDTADDADKRNLRSNAEESVTLDSGLPSVSDIELSRRLCSTLTRSGFIRSRAILQSAVSDVLQQILRQRGVRLSHNYMFIVGSYSEGWGNSLSCADGKTDVESDIDLMQLFTGRKYHLGDSCQCDAVTLSEVVSYDNGHIVCPGFASNAARASVGSILAQRPAVDEVSACELCCYPPVAPLQSARTALSNIPKRTLQTLQEVIKSRDWPCHVVHAAPPGQGGVQLRVSTTFLENRLLRSFSTIQGQVFVTLKYLVKKVIGRKVNGVKAYHAKTLMFRLLEETAADRWQADCLVSLTRRALLMLLEGVESSSSAPDCRILTHFFLGDAGLYLKGNDRSGVDTISQVLKDTIDQLPRLLLQFDSSLKPIEPNSGFRFHPFLVLPQQYPHNVPPLETKPLEYHQIYDVVCEVMLQLGSDVNSNAEHLAQLLGQLPDRATNSAREALRAMVGLKFGFVGTAERIMRYCADHKTGRGIPWPPSDIASVETEATTDYVWKHLVSCDSAYKFCLRFDRRPVFSFLPKFICDLFPTGLNEVSVTNYFMNFDALLRSLQFELLPETVLSATAISWFAGLSQRQSGDTDLQEVLTTLHYCPDVQLIDQLLTRQGDTISAAIAAGYSEARAELERFQQNRQAAVIADSLLADHLMLQQHKSDHLISS